MKVFISGRIRGIKYETAKRNFANAERAWRSENFEVVNPLKICREDWSWLHCMTICLWNLAKCDVAYFMSNYKDSIGSKIELFFAKLLGKTIVIA